MARRIIRRRRVAHHAPPRPEEVRPNAPKLPEAKTIPATRVLVVAPGAARTVLMTKLTGAEEVKVAGAASDEQSAIEKMVTEEADVAIVHIHTGQSLGGLDIARNIQRVCPQAGIIIFVAALDGLDLRRNARRFGVSWSYLLSENTDGSSALADLVRSAGRGIHWIDPKLRRVLEALWKVADEGRDLEIANAVQEIRAPKPAPAVLQPPAPQRGIQTMQAGNSGVGHGGFGVTRAS